MHKNIDEGLVGSCAYPENGLRANKRHEPLREFMIERGFMCGLRDAGVAAYMSPRGARCSPSTSRVRRARRSRIQGLS